MAIVKSYQKKTDTTYVYESESYWDPEKKQPRSKRKLIGKIDKETGEIIPTGTRGRKKAVLESDEKPKDRGPKATSQKISQLEDTVDELKQEILSLHTQIDGLKSEVRQLTSRSEKAEKMARKGQEAVVFLKKYKDLAEKADSAGLLDGL